MRDVIIVCDHPNRIKFLTRLLENTDSDITAVHEEEKVIYMIETTKPDLIIAHSSFFTEKIHEKIHNIKTIMVSNEPYDEKSTKNVDCWLKFPPDAHALLSAIRILLGEVKDEEKNTEKN